MFVCFVFFFLDSSVSESVTDHHIRRMSIVNYLICYFCYAKCEFQWNSFWFLNQSVSHAHKIAIIHRDAKKKKLIYLYNFFFFHFWNVGLVRWVLYKLLNIIVSAGIESRNIITILDSIFYPQHASFNVIFTYTLEAVSIN